MLSLEDTKEKSKKEPRTFYKKRHREWQSTIERAAQKKIKSENIYPELHDIKISWKSMKINYLL